MRASVRGGSCCHPNEYLPKRAGFRQFRATAKSNTIWQWRGIEFKSRKALLTHLTQRAREAAQGVLGPPVYEVRGEDRRVQSVRVKVQVSLGAWPPRHRKAPSLSGAAATAGKRRRPKGPSKAAVQKGVDKYFR